MKYSNEDLIKTFTYRKVLILHILSNLINNTNLPIPLISSKRTVTGLKFKLYLEQKTKLKARSLHSFYFNTLKDLEDDGIVNIKSTDDKKSRFLTKKGLKITVFYNSLIEFFGEECLFNIFEVLKKRKRKKIFLYVLAKIIDLTINKEKISEIEKILYTPFAGKTRKRFNDVLKLETKNIENSRPTYLEIKIISILSKKTASTLNILPVSKERRDSLINSISKAFQILLGRDLKKKKINDFKKLKGVFEAWNFLHIDERVSNGIINKFDNKISNIIDEQSKPLYALIVGNTFKFGTEFLNNEIVGINLQGIRISLKMLNKFLDFSINDLKIVEIAITLL